MCQTVGSGLVRLIRLDLTPKYVCDPLKAE